MLGQRFNAVDAARKMLPVHGYATDLFAKQRRLREAVMGTNPVHEALTRHTRLFKSPLVDNMVAGQRLVDSITGGSNVFKTMDRFRETFRDLLDRWRESFYAALPPNWRMLNEAEVEAVGDLMVETGWSLVWTPSATVLRALLAAPDHDARKAVLVAAEGQIVDDLERLLAQRASTRVSELRDSAREAIEVYRGGHFRAAQALAGAALTTGLHDHFGRRDFGALRRELGKLDPDEVGFTMFRTALVLSAARRTLKGYSHSKPPENFNRMATAHDLAGRQRSQANALTGLMLLVSLAVEVDELLRLPSDPGAEAQAA